MKQNSKLYNPSCCKEQSVLYQIFGDVKPLPVFLTNVKLSPLNLSILSKNNCKNIYKFKIFKGHHFLMGSRANISLACFYIFRCTLYKMKIRFFGQNKTKVIAI